MKSRMAGFTLIELLLVIAIAASLFILGFKFFVTIRNDADISQVQYNVDRLFAASSEYYQANCRRQIDPTTGAQYGTWGTLDPDYVPAPATNYPVTVSALTTSGFLGVALPRNRLIDNAVANNGYLVQFNQSPPTDRIVDGDKMGNIIIWRIQVAVAIRSSVPKAIVRMLGADCASVMNAGVVTPCSSAPVVPNTGVTVFAVWERLPSYAAPNADPNTWITNAQVKSFKQEYTNNNIVNWQPNYSAGPPDYQNYLCGS